MHVHTPCGFLFHRDRGHAFALRQSLRTHASTPHVPLVSIGITGAPLLSDDPLRTRASTIPCTFGFHRDHRPPFSLRGSPQTHNATCPHPMHLRFPSGSRTPLALGRCSGSYPAADAFVEARVAFVGSIREPGLGSGFGSLKRSPLSWMKVRAQGPHARSSSIGIAGPSFAVRRSPRTHAVNFPYTTN